MFICRRVYDRALFLESTKYCENSLNRQEARPVLRCSADRARQFQFGDVVGEEAVDVTQSGAGHGILRLHDGEIVRFSGFELLPVQFESLVINIDVPLSHIDLA